jgi:hypothetical protein
MTVAAPRLNMAPLGGSQTTLVTVSKTLVAVPVTEPNTTL